ncbi:histidine phosphatase family protein [candidate division KSB1 bacterium]|nr:histidine phosphatase family protein [candidate division KSB1 bacterium]
MKTLYLVRHAETAEANKNQKDIDRPLTKGGRKTAKQMAGNLKKVGVKVNALISSSAKRARETAKEFAKELGFSGKRIEMRDDLYNAIPAANQLKILKQLNQVQSVMIVGHVPNSEKLAAYLLTNIRAASIPKGGVVCIEFDCDTWADVERGSGTLKFVDFPLADKKQSKALRKNLQATLAVHLQKNLAEVDSVTAPKFKKYIKGSSAKLARSFVQVLQSRRLTGEVAMSVLKSSIPAQPAASAVKPAPRTRRRGRQRTKAANGRTTSRARKPKTRK